MDTAQRPAAAPTPAVYDGFVSYSHAADGLLAPRLQAGLQRFAKPWWKRRALRIFRDESSLSANPHLWSSIVEALDQSGWFVLLLSPDAAESPWVNQEIEYWKEHKDPSRILPVLTDGTFEWTGGDVSGTSVPEQLPGVFAEEPRWVDLRFAREEEQLDLKNPRFSAAVADIASALHGVPKDELESEEVRQHRRSVRTAGAGAALVGLLAIAATVFAFQASNNAQRAKARELAASAIQVGDEDPRLATWLALAAIDQTPEGEEQPVEVVNALWEALAADPFLATIEHGFGGNTFVDLSPDGQTLAISSAEGATLELRHAQTFEVLWKYSEETGDGFARPVFSPDGSMIAIDVMGSESGFTWREGATDDLPNRIIVLDSESGNRVEVLEFPYCEEAWAPDWSPDGSKLAVASGMAGGCQRQGVADPIWIEVFDTATWESQGVISIEQVGVLPEERDHAVRGIFLSDDLLGAFRSHNPLEVYDTATFELTEVYEDVTAPITPDASLTGGLIASHSNETLLAYLYDLESGSQLDVLGELEAWPAIPYGVSISEDGGMVAFATDSRVLVWDVATGEQTYRLTAGAGSTNAVFSQDGSRLYSAHRDGAVRVWSLRAGGSAFDWITSFAAGSHVNGNDFRVGGDIGTTVRFEFVPEFVSFIEFFSAETGELVAPPLETDGLAVPLPNDLVVARPMGSDRYELYDPLTGDGEPIGPDCSEMICDVVLSGTHDQFAIVYQDAQGYLQWNFFDSATAEPVGSETHDQAPRLADSFGASWVVTGDRDGNFAFIDRAGGDELLRIGEPSGRPEYSNDGRIVALRPDARTITLIDTEDWETTVLDLGFGRMRGLTFNPDDSLLAVGDEDEVLIVDVEAQTIIQEIPIPLVSDIHWIDETTLLVGDRSGSFWGTVSLDVDRLIERARESVADRPITAQECETYAIDPCPTLEELREG